MVNLLLKRVNNPTQNKELPLEVGSCLELSRDTVLTERNFFVFWNVKTKMLNHVFVSWQHMKLFNVMLSTVPNLSKSYLFPTGIPTMPCWWRASSRNGGRANLDHIFSFKFVVSKTEPCGGSMPVSPAPENLSPQKRKKKKNRSTSSIDMLTTGPQWTSLVPPPNLIFFQGPVNLNSNLLQDLVTFIQSGLQASLKSFIGLS